MLHPPWRTYTTQGGSGQDSGPPSVVFSAVADLGSSQGGSGQDSGPPSVDFSAVADLGSSQGGSGQDSGPPSVDFSAVADLGSSRPVLVSRGSSRRRLRRICNGRDAG